MRARYNQEHQSRDQHAKSALTSNDAATKSAARAGAPAQAAPEKGNSDLRSFFSMAEIKRRAAEEVARRENEQGNGMQRGGRGR